MTVSLPWADRFQQRAPNTRVDCTTNGYDPDDFAFLPVPLTKSFSITYAGLLYEGKRDPTPLLEVIYELIQSGAVARSDVEVRFYGPVEPWLRVLIQKTISKARYRFTASAAAMRHCDARLSPDLLLLGG